MIDLTSAQLVNEQGIPFTNEDLSEIDFGATGLKEILQNVKIILTTPIWSVPLDRLFGMDFSFIDEPQPIAQNTIMAEVLQKVGRFEPRVQVLGIDYSGKAIDGHMIPSVRLRLLPSQQAQTGLGELGRLEVTPWH